jgi:hypothetical protein
VNWRLLFLLAGFRLWRWRWLARGDSLQHAVKRIGRFVGAQLARHLFELGGLLSGGHLAFHRLKSKSNVAERKGAQYSLVFAASFIAIWSPARASLPLQSGGFLSPITIRAWCLGGDVYVRPLPMVTGGTSLGASCVPNLICAAKNACRRSSTWAFSGPGISIPKYRPSTVNGRKYTCHLATPLASFTAENPRFPIISSAKYFDSESSAANAISISPLPLASSSRNVFKLAGSIVRHWTSCFNLSCSNMAVSARSLACAICRRNDSTFAFASARSSSSWSASNCSPILPCFTDAAFNTASPAALLALAVRRSCVSSSILWEVSINKVSCNSAVSAPIKTVNPNASISLILFLGSRALRNASLILPSHVYLRNFHAPTSTSHSSNITPTITAPIAPYKTEYSSSVVLTDTQSKNDDMTRAVAMKRAARRATISTLLVVFAPIFGILICIARDAIATLYRSRKWRR